MKSARDEINTIVRSKSCNKENYKENYNKLFKRFFKKYRRYRTDSLKDYKVKLDYIEKIGLMPELLREARILFNGDYCEPLELIEKRRNIRKLQVEREKAKEEQQRKTIEEWKKKHIREITSEEIAAIFGGKIIKDSE
ncbi:hypothetical protein [Paenibacillus naphthalenovorans]|uniref:Uncharacterized protein n=1 Tax=Paenibacillus naphthalenovorans TaxID=162209 RepID=A0A0U2N2E3_9BACL|nr:hypothetical protein [Paenibacillus naphthalenovorans]ALS25359.1 hypothetical protein IJ22_51000 [Paenibacillus naphthalenovorans]